jgi:hypothetical protein
MLSPPAFEPESIVLSERLANRSRKMPSKEPHPFLPPELILSIIDWVPLADSRSIALRASHPVTKTLLSLARGAYIFSPYIAVEEGTANQTWPRPISFHHSGQEVMLTP